MVRSISTVLAVFMLLVGIADFASAQAAPQFPTQQPIPEVARNLLGVWQRDEPVRGNCGNLIDQNGQPRRNCALPVDQLPLNARALAWIQFFDEYQAPGYHCAANTIPTLLGDVRPFRIDVKSDAVVINYEHSNLIRYIWTDGRGHPSPYELTYQGHSIGRWEGADLVVESTNFTFDPDGMDDHAHIATSVRKKVTERYTFMPPDHVKITITLEDPIFLKKPFTWSHVWKKNNARVFDGWAECDPDVTSREVELTYKDKYIDK
jgi:hypothetical protein